MVLVTLTVGLVIWILAWAFGVKSFDAFMFTAFITLMAGGARIAMPFAQRFLKGVPLRPGER